MRDQLCVVNASDTRGAGHLAEISLATEGGNLVHVYIGKIVAQRDLPLPTAPA